MVVAMYEFSFIYIIPTYVKKGWIHMKKLWFEFNCWRVDGVARF